MCGIGVRSFLGMTLNIFLFIKNFNYIPWLLLKFYANFLYDKKKLIIVYKAVVLNYNFIFISNRIN